MSNIIEPPLTGNWHHGNGVLVCGSIRIARSDFDTDPNQAFQDSIFDYICKVLNNNTDNYFKEEINSDT